MNLMTRILDKCSSGRFLITVGVTFSLCFAIIGATIGFLWGKIAFTDFKGILDALGFPAVVSMVIIAYFNRNDRKGDVDEKGNS